jgi:hypothetical protein
MERRDRHTLGGRARGPRGLYAESIRRADSGGWQEREELFSRDQGVDNEPRGLQRLSAPFLAVNEGQHAQDLATGLTDGLNRLERRSASRDDILDYHDMVARLKRPFNQLAGPVLLGLLSNSKGPNHWSIPLFGGKRTGVGNGVGDRVGPKGQSADGVHRPPGGAQTSQPDPANEELPLRAHRRQAAVHIQGGPPTGGQHKIAPLGRTAGQQGDEGCRRGIRCVRRDRQGEPPIS